MRARSPIRWLAVLLALAGALAVALDASRRGDVDAGGGREEEAGVAGEMLAGEGATGAASASGPRLRGAPGELRATHGPVEVRVVDLEDAPVAGMLVTATWSTPPEVAGGQPETHTQQTFTDALGRAPFSRLPYDGTATVAAHLRTAGWGLPPGSALPPSRGRAWRVVQGTSQGPTESLGAQIELAPSAPEWNDVVVHGATSPDEPTPWAQGIVRGPALTLRIDPGLPLRVEVREGGSGRLHPDARWTVAPRIAWVPEATGTARLPVRRGEAAAVTLEVQAPGGTVARQPAHFLAFIHPAARRLLAVYPVRPEARIALVFPTKVQPFRPEDWEGRVTVAGSEVPAEHLRFDAQGRMQVHGVGYLAGERVTVEGRVGERWRVTGEAPLGATPRDLVLVPLRAVLLPPPTQEPDPEGETQTIEFTSEGGSPTIVINRSAPLPLAFGELLRGRFAAVGVTPPPRADTRAAAGRLTVSVLGPTGLPAPRAVVRAGGREAVCDEHGVARFPELDPGMVDVLAVGAGAGAKAQVSVEPGGAAELTLRAPHGGSLEVEVVDEEGRGLPYATLSLDQPHGLPWIDLDGDLQRLDPFTGPDGRRILRAVSLGKVKVGAAFGSRSASVEVEVKEGSAQTVRLVLPSVPLPAEPEAAPGAPTEDAPPPR